ncbi:MAG TPA: LysR substrate-binding domain-containing protein [Gammaproteobacteria bacterium]|nr:LysR substrate-binding domain-containing protein [Gammaproteobacteria bacterium]
MSDLHRFELFIYVAQATSLTAAADALGITKASLSKQIKRLESDYQVDLFARQGQRLHLTEQGRLLLSQCLRLKKELEDTRAICRQFNEEPEGDLHVVVFDFFARQLIYPKIKSFLETYPKIKLVIDTHERMPDFNREQVDLAVGFSLTAPAEIIQRRMASTRYVLCASKQYFAENGMPHTLEDLSRHHYIEHKVRSAQPLKLNAGYKIILQPYLLLNSVSAMIECAKEGLGLVQLPLYLLEKILAQGELIEVLAEYQATGASVYYYYPKYRYVQAKVRKFIDFFLEDAIN